MNKETIILTNYIASWFWHAFAVLFLINAIPYLHSNKIPYFIGFVAVMTFCEYMAFQRKEDVFNQ